MHFLVGGTQTNMTVIAAALKPWQGAICADTGHIACHETGAIEATGHKVLALSSEDGKITAAQIEETVKKHYEAVSISYSQVWYIFHFRLKAEHFTASRN